MSKVSTISRSTPSSDKRRALARNGVNRNGSSFGTEELARIGLEHDRAEGALVLASEAFCFQEQRAMAEMHAIEIAQGHHGALRVGGTVTIVTQDSHQAVSADALACSSLEGTFTSASPSTTTVSPTVQTQSNVTRPLGS